MNKENEKLKDALIAVIILIPSFLFGGYVGMKLWNWFISDTFNLLQLRLWQSIGLDIAITYFTSHAIHKDKNENKSYPITTGLFEKVIISAAFLGFGFIIKQFI